MMTKYIDIAGKIFNKLTAIESFKMDGKTLWTFQCQCGVYVDHPASRVVSGHVKSCGCTIKNRHTGEKSLAYDLFTRNYADGDLQFDKFYNMIFQNCYYCNSVPSNNYNRKNFRTKKLVHTLTYNGLDRLDSSLPHNINNVVACCWKCNKFKSTMHVDDFLAHIEAIYSNRLAGFVFGVKYA